MSGSDSHAHHHDHHGDHQLAGHPDADVHGMLVVGERTVYLSHLPMFGHPHHDVQAILEAHFTAEGSDPQAAYAEDRRASGERMYTLKPEPFVLQHLVRPEPGQECLCEFIGELYRGHFERDGHVLLSEVTVVVDHIVHFRQFDPRADMPVVLHELLFGTGEECFLAHFISRPPDFDQVVSARVTGEAVSDDELRKGPTLFFPRRANDATNRLQPGERVSAEVAGGTRPITLEIGEELYFEEGELGETFSTSQTPDEKQAGF